MDPHEGEQAVAYALDPPSQCPDMSVKQCEPEKVTQSVFRFLCFLCLLPSSDKKKANVNGHINDNRIVVLS